MDKNLLSDVFKESQAFLYKMIWNRAIQKVSEEIASIPDTENIRNACIQKIKGLRLL